MLNRYYAAALKCGDWFVNNQIKGNSDANRGRYLAEWHLKNKTVNEWSTNWTTGMSVISLLMLYKRSKKKKYLDSALLAGQYILSIQDEDGFIREETPQTDWCHPRDALSAAWGMLHLARVTGNEVYLDSTLRFAEWFKKNAMINGYPAWTCYRDNRPPVTDIGSFHGGSPAYFFDLAELTGSRKWASDIAVPILDNYLTFCQRHDGSIKVIADRKGRSLEKQKRWEKYAGWLHMHHFNDDLTSLALLRGAWECSEERYFTGAEKFLNRACDHQDSRGYFGDPPVPSGVPILICSMLAADRMCPNNRFRAAAEKAGGALLGLQCRNKDVRAEGGFYGMMGLKDLRIDQVLHIRTSCYAVAALLQLEGKLEYDCYCG